MSPTRGERVELRIGEAQDVALIVLREAGRDLGRLSYRLAEGWLTFEWMEIEPGCRGWGYGSEAVRLLEVEAGGERFRANVDARNGLGLYFWLRLGYRPARPDEVPGGSTRGIITMVRAAGDGPG